MKNIEAIIFDLGGVILNIDYNLTRVAFEKAGVKNFDEMYSQSAADPLFRKLETGSISEKNFYEQINKQTGLSLSTMEIQQAWNSMLLTFREKSLEFIEKLKPRYKLFLLSNTNHIHLKNFRQIYLTKKREKPFEKYFDKVYYSCEIGLRKPDLASYEAVIKENNLEPSHIVFIDDSIQNIIAAKGIGLQTILLEAGKNIEDLEL